MTTFESDKHNGYFSGSPLSQHWVETLVVLPRNTKYSVPMCNRGIIWVRTCLLINESVPIFTYLLTFWITSVASSVNCLCISLIHTFLLICWSSFYVLDINSLSHLSLMLSFVNSSYLFNKGYYFLLNKYLYFNVNKYFFLPFDLHCLINFFLL